MNFVIQVIVKNAKEKKRFIYRDLPPVAEDPALMFREWNIGDLMPLTKSINLNHETFYELLKCARVILGHGGACAHMSKEQKQMGSGVTTKIADHSLRYLWDCTTEEKNVVWPMWDVKILQDNDNANVAEIIHSCDATVHKCKEKQMQVLFDDLAEKEVGPIPARQKQKFGNWEMKQYAPSTKTLLCVEVLGADTKGGLEILTENVLHGQPKLQEKVTVMKELQDKLGAWFVTELQNRGIWNKECEEMDGWNFVYHVRFMQSRFDTGVRVRPAPHMEFTPEQITKMHEDGVFVKDYVVAGREGMWYRLFQHSNDFRGRLIRIQAGSILGVPGIAIREVGRISHIEGDPHYVIRVMASREKNSCDMAGNTYPSTRFYPHLRNTVENLKAANANDWEECLRTVGTTRTGYLNTCVDGIDEETCNTLSCFKTTEVTAFDDYLEI